MQYVIRDYQDYNNMQIREGVRAVQNREGVRAVQNRRVGALRASVCQQEADGDRAGRVTLRR